MRETAPGSKVTQRRRDPRLVVAIIFPFGSIYITNRPAWRTVPLVNAGFESGGFDAWVRGPTISNTIVTGGEQRSGSYAVKSTTTGQVGNPNLPIVRSTLGTYPARAGEMYRLRAWVRRDEGDLPDHPVALSAEFVDGGGSSISFLGTTVGSTSTSGWQELVSPVFTAPANTAEIRPGLFWRGQSQACNGTWYVDDVRLERFVGIQNVPGNVIHGALTDISSSSQALSPDEARATIGSLSFTAVDIRSAITEELREQLLDFDAGVRLREVRIFTGDTDDFNDFERVETYVVDNVIELDGRSYRFQCSDRNREQRVDVFERSRTRLDVTLSETETDEMTVQSTDGFSMVAHTASFSHRPNETVGYIRIRQTGEIIAYTGKTDTTFTGLERGCFGTRPQEVVVDPATQADRRPEIEEVIYLELPGPELDYAIMTGKIRSTGATLPSRWHMGIDESHVDGASFDSIGTDLYDPNDGSKGFILRFLHEDKQDGKRFLEEQVRLPCGTVCVVDAMGRFVLRRMVSLISTANPAAILFDNNIIEHGPVRYNLSRLINQVVFDWNFDGERYTRTNLMINPASVGRHQKSKPKTIKLRGLHVNRHSVATLRRIFATLTDRYGAPPIEMTARLSRSMNQLEIADVARVVLGRVADHTAVGHLDRTFEIQRRAMNWKTGELQVTLFGSTARPQEATGGGSGPILDDAWYTSEGTDLTTVLTISNGVVTANGTLTGAEDLRNAVFYYDGDLTIASGVTVTISGNVQLRIKGELTVNGKIDGAGKGIAAIADPNTLDQPYTTIPTGPNYPLNPQTLGSTMGSGGVRYTPSLGLYSTWEGPLRAGQPAVARPALAVESGALVNLPNDLRGTPGIYGGPVVEETQFPPLVRQLGGAGGASGAGLMIISRGLAFGVGGQIDLSGADGAAPTSITLGGRELYPGAGGGGAAGGLLVVLDGDDIVAPDLSNSFIANHGATPKIGTPIQFVYSSLPDAPEEPWTGFGPGIGAVDAWEASHLSVYVPSDIALGASEDEITPAPRDLSAVGDGTGVRLSWELPPSHTYDVVELFESLDNDRANAVLIFRGRASSFTRTSDTQITRYYWIRARDDVKGPSEWEPVSATGGVQATFGGAVGPQGPQGPPGEDAVTFAITANAPLQFRQAANGGAWSHNQVDVTFSVLRGGSEIGEHVVRVTRSNATLSAATLSESGEATTEQIVGNGTPVVTIIVTHDASGAAAAQSVSAVQGGDQGAEGPEGPPGADGRVKQYVFRRSATQPATPTGDGVPSGWSDTPPADNGQPLWTSVALQELDGTTIGSWSTPIRLDGQDGATGAPGMNVARARIYRRSATTPSLPSSTATFTFATGAITGLNNGWAATIPAPDGNPLWISEATAASSGATDTIAPNEWASPVVFVQDGINSATVYLYQRTTTNSAPSLPASTLTYTFATGALSGSLGSWSQTVPPDSNGAHLWVTTATALSAGPTDTIAPGEWAAVRKLGQAVTWRSGNGAPAGSLGNVGDFYLDEQTGNVYEKTGASTWTLRSNIQGPEGPEGPPGQDGEDGESYWTPVLVNVTRTGKTFEKTGGNNAAYDASVYSEEAYPSCHVSFRPGQTNASIMIGLDTDPAASHSSSQLDVCINVFADGDAHIFENGVYIQSLGSYTTNDVFTITYDGYYVRYYKNNQLVRSLSWPGQLLYLDSTFREVGGKVHDLVFQPGELGLIDLQTKVSGILSTAFMAAGAINSNITINADGTLSGAGGGQVQIGQLPGSVAVGQLTANIVTALQVVAATLSAIRAELGHVVISSSGSIRCGASEYDGDGGWWLGIHDGEPAFSMRAGEAFIRMKPSFGIETSILETRTLYLSATLTVGSESPWFGYANVGPGPGAESYGSLSRITYYDGIFQPRVVSRVKWQVHASTGVVWFSIGGTSVPNNDRTFVSIQIGSLTLTRANASYTANDGVNSTVWAWGNLNTSDLPTSGTITVRVKGASLS